MSLVVVGTVPSPVPLGVQATSTDAHRQVAPSVAYTWPLQRAIKHWTCIKQHGFLLERP